MSEDLQHYGVKRRSGRYPWGSGKDPQRSQDILSKVDELKGKGFSETEIAKQLGMNTSQLRSEITIGNNIRKQVLMEGVQSRVERGDSNTKIAKDLGISEATVRNYKTQKDQVFEKQLDNISLSLRENIEDVGYLDVGVGVERQMGISKDKLKAAIQQLESEGYVVHEIYVKRLTDPSKYTTVKVLTKEKDLEVVKQNSDKIRPPDAWTDDGGLTVQGLQPIKSVDWKQIEIRYGEEGGADKDGVIELRRGAKDLDLGSKNYAQVRIAVNDSHYLKGMAMYSDDMPKGKDIVFNTNKPKGTDKEKVLKELKDNPDNRFGATIKAGGQRGALNIVNEEGDWNKWSSTLSAQFLSKQPQKLVKDRLDKTYESLIKEYGELSVLTNPLVKKHLLQKFNDGLETKQRHLKAEGLPKTKSHVILPFPGMKPNEVYAPNYKDGDSVVLVRYPHGGIFELPELKVNNKGPAKNIIKNAIDAIGIHPSVAQKLSGADFDGDTVYVIPNNKRQIKTSRSLKELKNFDPISYQVANKTITPDRKQKEMGVVSNLITDMTIKGATQGELARAVKHSMVVIDSEKHRLDYKQSAIDNGINALKTKYQTHVSPVTGKQSKGASTLISKSKQKMTEKDPETGKTVTMKRKGKPVYLVNHLSDANKLSSGSAVENLYASYINKVKKLDTKSKKTILGIKPVVRNKEAAKLYSAEVKSLDKKLNKALLNAPRERQAQLQASKNFYAKRTEDMTKDDLKKLKNQVLSAARIKVKAERSTITFTDKEWKAVQAGAISNDKLGKILNNADLKQVKQLATPKPRTKMPTARLTRARGMLNKGYTYAEVAQQLGLSVSALRYNLEEANI